MADLTAAESLAERVFASAVVSLRELRGKDDMYDAIAYVCGCVEANYLDELGPERCDSICRLLENVAHSWTWPELHDCDAYWFDVDVHDCRQCETARRDAEAEHYARMNIRWAETMGPILFPEEYRK